MKNKMLLLLLAMQAAVFTTNAQVRKTSNGIIVNAGGHQVGLFTTNNAAFCLSLNGEMIKSTFIASGNSASSPYTVVSTPPLYGIKTAYGQLTINTTTGTWSLYDAKGQPLIQNGAYRFTDSSVEIDHTIQGLLYGAGNISSKDLTKSQSGSAVGNGVAGIPYLWNTTGYSAFGVAANDNQPASWTTNHNQLAWKFPSKIANLYLWPASTIYDGAKGYVKLTGQPKLPPRWAFGYLQSQWGWEDSTYISNVLTKFRTLHLPVDAFIFDFEWYTTTPDYTVPKEGQKGYSDFTFNPKLFPHPAKQIADMKAQGVKFIGIRKPRLGNDQRLDTARKNGWLMNPHTDSRDLNFSNADLRQWFEDRTKPMLQAGVDAWWDDEGESYYTCYYWWNTAQCNLLSTVRPNYRHFTINRAFSPGNQRFGYCTWDGDIQSSWSSLADVPKDLLNFSLAGMYYGACDIGGFHGTPEKETLVRWFQAGVFFPIMRSHSDFGTTARFPFLWGDDGEAAIRKALELRYQLLPYTYSLGHEAYNNGAPIMRPLVMEFPTDTTVANMTDEWLFGKGVLAAPVLNAGGKRRVYIPADTWYDYFSGEKITGPKTIEVNKQLDEIPVYVRAGTILPLSPVVQYSEQATTAPLEIHIYPGKNGSFNMVEDDGTSYNYIKGATRTTAFLWDDATKTLSWKVSGGYAGKHAYKMMKAVIGKEEKSGMIGKDGKLSF
ncbi:glycoside hydrolase family 31 protein [Chitinophaga sancti]|uniref:glycoside hydrolase family 31 protein n=1 Tax=Chitinophaga sancti TaxID=1004 RepID=UPI002A749755|nr:TIM-barrel domain-containing protein [Chitinophaga sancti]WPQ66437.1 glycoside hydrolase family 31 protein [Chitinophaga sancti]